jgi:hypothetical protein
MSVEHAPPVRVGQALGGARHEVDGRGAWQPRRATAPDVEARALLGRADEEHPTLVLLDVDQTRDGRVGQAAGGPGGAQQVLPHLAPLLGLERVEHLDRLHHHGMARGTVTCEQAPAEERAAPVLDDVEAADGVGAHGVSGASEPPSSKG